MDQFIQVYEKAFSDTFCDTAINYIDLAEQVGTAVNRQDHDNAQRIHKQDVSTFLPEIPSLIPELPIQEASDTLLKEFNVTFWEHCYKQYANNFDILKTLGPHKSYTMKIQKTRPGEGYHIWHSEVANRETCHRLLTWSIYLNDEFEAGETEFLYQHYRYKPSKGDCIIFPAAFTHTHRGNPPIGGDKYIITGWVEF